MVSGFSAGVEASGAAGAVHAANAVDALDATDAANATNAADEVDVADVSDAAEAADVSGIADVADASGAAGAVHAANAVDALDATDAANATDAPNASDIANAADASDIVNAADASDAADAAGVVNVADAPDAADEVDAADVSDAADAVDVANAGDVVDAANTTDASDAADATDAAGTTPSRRPLTPHPLVDPIFYRFSRASHEGPGGVEGAVPPETAVRPRTQTLTVNPVARLKGTLAASGFRLAAYSTFLVVGLIVWLLVSKSTEFFAAVDLKEFFTGDRWSITTTEANNSYGILAPLSGTLLVAVLSPLLAVPFGLGAAVYLAEYAPPGVRRVVKPSLEILTGIPSIVMGFFAYSVIRPWVNGASEPGHLLYYLFGGHSTAQYNMLSAIIAVAIMILPIITTFSEDALRAVPKHLKEASLGLGATRWETTIKVVFPAAVSGISASIVLAVARAIGETMAVTMVGGFPKIANFNPLEGALAATSAIAATAANEIPHQGPGYASLFVVGLVLFVLTLGMNLVAQRIVKRFREVEVQ